MTAATQLGSRVLGLVLTGMGCDGAAFIRQSGGIVIVQDPDSAEADGMPMAAIDACAPDLVLPPAAIASAVTSLYEVIRTRELLCGRQLTAGARIA